MNIINILEWLFLIGFGLAVAGFVFQIVFGFLSVGIMLIVTAVGFLGKKIIEVFTGKSNN